MPTIDFTNEEVSVLTRFMTSFSTKNLDMKTFENDQYTGRFVDELREKIKYSCTYKPHDVAIVIEEKEV